jgi:hypothetical protein
MIADINNQIDDFIAANGDSITVYTISETTDSYGDATTTYSSGVSSKALIMNANKDMQAQGEGYITQGVPRMLLKSTETIALKDKITHRSIDYQVTAIRLYSNFEDVSNQPKVVELTRLL